MLLYADVFPCEWTWSRVQASHAIAPLSYFMFGPLEILSASHP
jgi:hypothetical protein